LIKKKKRGGKKKEKKRGKEEEEKETPIESDPFHFLFARPGESPDWNF